MSFTLHSDLERDCIRLGDFPLSSVLLMNDGTYPWFLLVPRVADVKDAHELSLEDQQQLAIESRILSQALIDAFGGEKMNVAALGNMTPQLHVHHVVRFKKDVAWPGPIWGKVPMAPMTETEIQRRADALAAQLEETGIAYQAYGGVS